MKRGLIKWDQAELPASAFESRLGRVRDVLAHRDFPALLVYSDVWRSNQARFLTNYMPYWNRSLVLIPREGAPVLLCGLSPRVYPWIRSTTVFEEIRPAGKLVPALTGLCAERDWTRLAVLELAQIPHEVHEPLTRTALEIASIPAAEALGTGGDTAENSMREKAAALAREVLSRELPEGAGTSDYRFSGRLERALRLAGAEDVVILLSTGRTLPRPACGAILGDTYSVSVAVEYCGHWAKITRTQASAAVCAMLRERFDTAAGSGEGVYIENLAGAYPFEAGVEIGDGPVVALQVEVAIDRRRLFYGDISHRL